MDKEELEKKIRENTGTIAIIMIALVILFAVNSYVALVPTTTIPIIAAPITNSNDTTINLNDTTINLNDTTINLNDTTANNTEDERFKSWVYISFRPIVDDIICISKAAKKQNLNDTELCGKHLRENSNLSLMDIDQFNISSPLEDARIEYKKSLEYFNLAGVNLEIGVKNRDPQRMYNATIYVQNGTSNMERVVMLLGNDTKVPIIGTG